MTCTERCGALEAFEGGRRVGPTQPHAMNGAFQAGICLITAGRRKPHGNWSFVTAREAFGPGDPLKNLLAS